MNCIDCRHSMLSNEPFKLYCFKFAVKVTPSDVDKCEEFKVMGDNGLDDFYGEE